MLGVLRGPLTYLDATAPALMQHLRNTASAAAWSYRVAQQHNQQQFTELLLALAQYVASAVRAEQALEYVLETMMEWSTASHGCLLQVMEGRLQPLITRGYTGADLPALRRNADDPQSVANRAYHVQGLVRQSADRLAQGAGELAIPVLAQGQVLAIFHLQGLQPAASAGLQHDRFLQLAGLARGPLLRMHPPVEPALPTTLPIADQYLVSARLAAVTDLASGMAHEINNPLTSILGFATLLLRSGELSEEARHDVQQIAVEGERIAGLVQRFLRFARPTEHGKRALPIAEPLMEALSLLRPRLQEAVVRVDLVQPAGLPMVLGQPSQLEQVFLDLLRNAIEAMSTTPDPWLYISIEQQGQSVRVALRDNGCGIEPALLRRIFEPGFTTKTEQGASRGLGLGLYVAHTIIQAHWGYIEVSSVPGQGSTFTLCLPALELPEQEQP